MSKIVLMYHDVYRDSETESGFQFPTSYPYKVSAAEFEKHVRLAYDYCHEHGIAQSSVEFSFDDGGESFYSVAAPILEKYGFRGIFFISTSYLASDKFMTAEQVRELHERGHIIASHSHSHPRNMTRLGVEELRNEWCTSLRILSEIVGEPVRTASIPSGFNSKEVIATAKEAGITTLYTSAPSDRVRNYEGMTIIGRYVVLCNTSTSAVHSIISSRCRRLRLSLRAQLLALAKKVLGANYNRIKTKIVR
ncbi:MAG: polysaccharide deacetylase family protein [Alistipes sp.]|nr:polysaccharide deacetylase family protein [Alistipes sp.]